MEADTAAAVAVGGGGEQENNGTIDEEIFYYDLDFLPSGIRFCPTDQDLIVYYLDRKVKKLSLPPNKIVDVKFYEYNPQILSETYKPVEEDEWYFFTPRERKYPKGSRPNRQAGEGFWKATGADKPVKSRSNGDAVIGYNRALVYYEGKPPKGDRKTEWLMHEYRVNGPPGTRERHNGDDDDNNILDEWVLCRLYKKGSKINGRSQNGSREEQEQTSASFPFDLPPEAANNCPEDGGDCAQQLDFPPSISFDLPPEDANNRQEDGGELCVQLADFPPYVDFTSSTPQLWDMGYINHPMMMYGCGGRSNDNVLLQAMASSSHHNYSYGAYQVPMVEPLSSMAPASDHQFAAADSFVGSSYDQSANSNWDLINPSGGVQFHGGCWAQTNYSTDPSSQMNECNSGLLDYSDGYNAQFVRMDQIVTRTAQYQPMMNDPSSSGHGALPPPTSNVDQLNFNSE